MGAVAELTIDLSDIASVVNRRYVPLLWDEARYLVLMGGAGSGKSHFIAQKLLMRLATEPGHRLLVLRKVASTLRKSVFQLFLDVLLDWEWLSFCHVNRTDMTLTFGPTGGTIYFCGLDDPEKLKSIAGITSVWLEEATEFTEGDLEQVNLRLRGKTASYKQIILSFNPISIYHWLKRRFWDLPNNGEVRRAVTTYRDNAYLDPEYIRELERLKDRDYALWRVYACGQWGVYKGLIYPAWDVPDVWPAWFEETLYGLDFGFNAPSALVEVGMRDLVPYPTERLYETGLTTGELIGRMEGLGISRSDPIYADAAEPDRIQEICNAGFNCVPADKGPGSLEAGIMTVRRMMRYTRPENVNLNREAAMYKYRETKDGVLLDEPVKANDHALDALRYALHTHCGPRGGGGALEGLEWR